MLLSVIICLQVINKSTRGCNGGGDGDSGVVFQELF